MPMPPRPSSSRISYPGTTGQPPRGGRVGQLFVISPSGLEGRSGVPGRQQEGVMEGNAVVSTPRGGSTISTLRVAINKDFAGTVSTSASGGGLTTWTWRVGGY